MKGVFDSIRENLTGGVSQTRDNEEYSVGNLFVSKPTDI